MSEIETDTASSYDTAMLETRLGPLGLLPSFETTAETRDKLETLETFSVDRELRVLSKDQNFPPLLVDRGLPTLAKEFKRFMSLALLFPNQKYNFAPSRLVDRVWHELILDTRRYQAMCMDTYGTFVHHNPLDPDQIAKNAGEVMRYTKECMSAAYGGPVPWIWGGLIISRQDGDQTALSGGFYTSHCDQYACC